MPPGYSEHSISPQMLVPEDGRRRYAAAAGSGHSANPQASAPGPWPGAPRSPAAWATGTRSAWAACAPAATAATASNARRLVPVMAGLTR